jgi:hypothetical protein
MPSLTPEGIRRILANPFNCINIAPELCSQHQPTVSEEQWIAAAEKLIAQRGVEAFLTDLLANLKGNYLRD